VSSCRLPFRIPQVRPRETGHAAHEPLISRNVIEDVPLAGLSLILLSDISTACHALS